MVGAFGVRETVEACADGVPEFVEAAWWLGADERLELSEDLLDRVEVWRVGRQVAQPGPAGLDGGAHAGYLVALQVAADGDVAWCERRGEVLLDIGPEGGA